MRLHKFFFLITLLAVPSLNYFGQTVTLLKRLDDDAGRYGQKVAQFFEGQPGNDSKRKALEPFVIGYYGWKAKVLTQFGVGKIEAAHLDICRIMLGLYDPEIDSNLKLIVARAKTPTNWVDVSDAEKAAIHKFVVMKYGLKYLGFSESFDGKRTSQISVSDKWKSSLGSSLGELAGNLVNWYKFPTTDAYPKNISKLLVNLQKHFDDAPKGVSIDLLANLRRLSALGNRTSYNEAERERVAAALREVLYSTLSFAGIENISVSARGNPENVSASDRSNNYLEKGKSLAERGDYKNAVANFTQSIELNPANGMAYYHRAKALEALGEIDNAIKDYYLMIAYKTDLRKAYYNRGTLFMEKKDHSAAIQDFNSSLKIDPKYVNAYYNRGWTYLVLKNFDKAISDFSRVLTLSPKETDALINRSLAYCKKGQTALAFRDQEQAILLGAKISKGC